jgi:hypothetical protein
MSDPSKPCAICGKPQTARFAPFCSRRCADLDLGRWLKEGYVVPGRPDEAQTPKDDPGQVPDEE